MSVHSHLNCKINTCASRIYVAVEGLGLHIGCVYCGKNPPFNTWYTSYGTYVWQIPYACVCVDWTPWLLFYDKTSLFFTFMEQKEKFVLIFKTGKYCAHIKVTMTTIYVAFCLCYPFISYTIHIEPSMVLLSHIKISHQIVVWAWAICVYIKMTSSSFEANWCTWTHLIRSINVYGSPGTNWFAFHLHPSTWKRNQQIYYHKRNFQRFV